MYIDGINVSTYDHGSVASISYSANNSLMIGAEPGSGSTISWPSGATYFLGRISTVRVYNRALSTAEIQQNYIATKSRYGL
jgi:hypothetical protein